jgi:hypothetical protein
MLAAARPIRGIVPAFTSMPLLLAALLSVAALQAPAPAAANIWEGRPTEFEEYLRTAPVTKIEEVPIGITHPKRAFTQPGGLARSFAWKPLRPGMYNGYWESYRSEIAAYELDKLLELKMVPVVVERRINGDTGAAVLWLEGVRSWEQILPLPKPPTWGTRLVRMKMFDNLVGNSDRNKGNMLVDEAWNLYLIDHSRAFVRDRKLPAPLQNIDRALWQRMQALDEATLDERLGKWLDRGQIRSILQRRDGLKKMIDALVAQNGDKVFFVP